MNSIKFLFIIILELIYYGFFMSITNVLEVLRTEHGSAQRSDLGNLMAASQAATEKARIDQKSYLVGFMGLTGICLGFALDTAERVEKWIRSAGAAFGVPLELAQSPTKRIQHYEKLLSLAVFQSLQKGDDWREIRQTWDAPLLATIQSKFQQIIKRQTGIVVTERRPAGEDLLNTTEIPLVLSGLTEAQPADHFLVFFTDPKETIYKQHVVYIHPQSRLFADGANCLTWAARASTERVFLDTVGNFLQHEYSHFPKFFLYKAQFESIPSRSLLYDRVCSRVETLGRIALQSPRIAAYFAASYVLPNSCLERVGQVQSLEEVFYGKLNTLLQEKNFPGFLSVIERQIPRIPSTLISPKFKGHLADYVSLLTSLREKDGPYQEIATWLAKGMLNKVIQDISECFDGEASEKDPRRMLKQFLEVRGSIANRSEICNLMVNFVLREQDYLLDECFKVGEFGDNTSPDQHPSSTVYALCRRAGTLDVLKRAVSYGANPFADFYPPGNGPIDAARRFGLHDVVAYLESIRPGGSITPA